MGDLKKKFKEINATFVTMSAELTEIKEFKLDLTLKYEQCKVENKAQTDKAARYEDSNKDLKASNTKYLNMHAQYEQEMADNRNEILEIKKTLGVHRSNNERLRDENEAYKS
jgi:esterase/lipase